MNFAILTPILLAFALLLQLFHLSKNKQLYKLTFVLFSLSHIVSISNYYNEGYPMDSFKVIIEYFNAIVAAIIVYYI